MGAWGRDDDADDTAGGGKKCGWTRVCRDSVKGGGEIKREKRRKDKRAGATIRREASTAHQRESKERTQRPLQPKTRGGGHTQNREVKCNVHGSLELGSHDNFFMLLIQKKLEFCFSH